MIQENDQFLHDSRLQTKPYGEMLVNRLVKTKKTNLIHPFSATGSKEAGIIAKLRITQ